jgi:hypothetical protein
MRQSVMLPPGVDCSQQAGSPGIEDSGYPAVVRDRAGRRNTPTARKARTQTPVGRLVPTDVRLDSRPCCGLVASRSRRRLLAHGGLGMTGWGWAVDLIEIRN